MNRHLNDAEQTIFDYLKKIDMPATTREIFHAIHGQDIEPTKRDSDKISQLLYYMSRENIIESAPVPNDKYNRKIYWINKEDTMTQDNLASRDEITPLEALEVVKKAIQTPKPIPYVISRLDEKKQFLTAEAIRSSDLRAQLFYQIMADLVAINERGKLTFTPHQEKRD